MYCAIHLLKSNRNNNYYKMLTFSATQVHLIFQEHIFYYLNRSNNLLVFILRDVLKFVPR